ncbi:argininosuccinate lyase [Candidatus Palauibacter sp.]|uniref:argininosuccinate lyase n=1 Tax=Candidatus Palauibacter sp. TaxID=3101350 RepID=UPI003AF22546
MASEVDGPDAGTPGDVLWSGRFDGPLHPAIHEFTGSLHFDRRLVRHDLLASLAHARMLRETGILDEEDSDLILSGLSRMLTEVETGRLEVEGPDEDVHSWIERTLVERVGEAGKRLHAARSRNDQTAVALRLYVRERLEDVLAGVAGLQRVLTGQAATHRKTFLPGYTHLQRGQPVSLAHHLLAHVAALRSDAERLKAAHDSAGVSPLGAGALAGSSFPIDPERCTALLGLDRTFANSMHIVGDRDYVLDAAYACALLLVHLSRWADEIVLWSTREFGFIELDDSVSQGSSIMPQKKNPEAAEILRGKSARAIGNVTALLALMKGLPLTFNSDFQEDKERLFDSLDTADWSLAAAIAIARGVVYRTDAMEAALAGGMLTATELADHLVRRGVPFRTAHHQVGEAVRIAEEAGVELWDLELETLRTCCPMARDDVHEVLRPEAAVTAHDSPGGPAPGRVLEQLQTADREVTELERWLDDRPDSPIRRAYLEERLLDEVLA